MIDLRTLREDPESVRTSQRTRGEDPDLVDVLRSADERRRAAVARADTLRAEQKLLGRQVGRARGEERDQLLARGKELAASVRAAEAEQAQAEADLSERHVLVPNLVHPDAPTGGGDDYVVLKEVGARPEFDFEPAGHVDLGARLGAIDVERGARVSGARFHYLTGVGAQLELALLSLVASRAAEHGFTLMAPPVLVRQETLSAIGALAARPREAHRLAEEDLYLIGTPEVPLAAYHADEILDLSAGPRRYTAWSTSFHREPHIQPKDAVRTVLHAAQSTKVGFFVYCAPQTAEDEHRRLLACQEELLTATEIPYRVTDVPAGDLARAASRTFACEAWLPGPRRHHRLTSTSNCTTYQARRLSVRHRDDHHRPRTAATLTGTLNTTSWIATILENHQQPDGSVPLPAALHPYLTHTVLTA